MKYLTVCSVHKREGHRLREWIEYHKMVGVEHFYLFDSNDPPDPETDLILAPYIDAGIVSNKRSLKDGGGWQVRRYSEILERKPESTWICFIDIDEFMLPQMHDHLHVVLRSYEKYAGLGVNWRIFGTSGCVEMPRLVTKSLTKTPLTALSDNQHIKTFCRWSEVARAIDPHSFLPLRGSIVGEDHLPVTGPRRPFSDNHIICNHYIVRSVEDYKIKVERGPGNRPPERNGYSADYFKRFDRSDACSQRMKDHFSPRLELILKS